MGRNRNVNHQTDDFYRIHLYGSSGAAFMRNAPRNNRALVERMYRRVLIELAANRFKWLNMPATIDLRFLETTLFYNALSVFYWDDKYDRYFALRGTGEGQPNMYDNPTSFRVTGNSFVNRSISAKECVPIWANYLRIPDLDIITVFAKELAEAHTTVSINMKSARRNKLLVASENQRLSLENINKQIDEGNPTIRLNTGIDGMIQNIDLGVHPDHIINMHILKTRLWNECMGLLGINNANQDKKERLVAAEVDANNEQVASNKHVNLNARKEAAQKINKMFGLKVDVQYNTDIDAQMQSAQENLGIPTINSEGTDTIDKRD